MAPTRDLSWLLLLLLHTSLLALCGCNAALRKFCYYNSATTIVRVNIWQTSLLGITQPPTSRVVVLGENATFHCSAFGGSFQWTINITSRTTPYSVAYNTTIPEYGITAQINRQERDGDNQYTATLTVEGRVDTNNTALHCVVFTLNSHSVSETVTLTVIGESCYGNSKSTCTTVVLCML